MCASSNSILLLLVLLLLVLLLVVVLFFLVSPICVVWICVYGVDMCVWCACLHVGVVM